MNSAILHYNQLCISMHSPSCCVSAVKNINNIDEFKYGVLYVSKLC